MKRYTFFIFFLFFAVRILAQDVRVYTEEKGNETTFYVDNLSICERSLKIIFIEANNICTSKEYFFLLPANTTQKKIFAISPCNAKKAWSYEYKFWHCIGNVNGTSHQANFNYGLPYPKGEEYELGQGFFGTYSHQNSYALDFFMPEGTTVCAMRGGKVVKVKENSDIGGPDKKFANDGNCIYILHNDGTTGVYYHFKKDGATVNVGDVVKKGAIIGYSGNTGFSSIPHLHVEIRLPDYKNEKTVEPKIKSGNQILNLKQGVFYKNEG